MDELFLQLARRVQSFKEKTGLTSRQLCRLTGIDEQHFSDFLNGRRGLGTSHTMQLLQVLNGSKKAHPKNAQIAHFRQNGRELAGTLRFDIPGNSGWVPGQSGDDRNSAGGDVTTNRSTGAEGGDSIIDVLRQVQLLYRQAIGAIDNWFSDCQKAKPNVQGSTEGPRHSPENAISSRPGPHSDKFSLQKELERTRQRREDNEEELRLRKEIAFEKSKSTTAMMELLAIEPESEKLARDARLRKLAKR